MGSYGRSHEVMDQSGTLVFDDESMFLARLTAMGDIAFHEAVLAGSLRNADSVVFEGVKTCLAKADIKFGNLETVIAEKPEIRFSKKACRVADIRAIAALRSIGVDVLSFANNHVKDMGSEGVLETINHVTQAGIKIVGAGRNIAEARKPVVVETKGLKVRFFAYSYAAGQIATNRKPGCAEADLKTIIDDLDTHEVDSDLTVLSLHMDAEFQEVPSPSRVKICRTLADKGVQIILCHHPHVPQGVERWNNSLIAYSLGNYVGEVTNYMTLNSDDCWKSFHLNIDIVENGIGCVNAVPVVIGKNGRPVLANEYDNNKILKLLADRSSLLLNEVYINKAYREMVIKWLCNCIKTTYWSIRKLEFNIVKNIIIDTFLTKTKRRWLIACFIKKYERINNENK